MKNERKEFDEQTYSLKTSPEMTNLQEEWEATNNETSSDEPTHDEEHYSALEEGTLVESDIAKQANRLAIYYVRSLLLF